MSSAGTREMRSRGDIRAANTVTESHDVIKFVLAELPEPPRSFSNQHYWTFLVSDSKLAVFRADTGFESRFTLPRFFLTNGSIPRSVAIDTSHRLES